MSNKKELTELETSINRMKGNINLLLEYKEKFDVHDCPKCGHRTIHEKTFERPATFSDLFFRLFGKE